MTLSRLGQGFYTSLLAYHATGFSTMHILFHSYFETVEDAKSFVFFFPAIQLVGEGPYSIGLPIVLYSTLEDTLTLLCLGEEKIYLDNFDIKLRKKLLCTLFF